MTHALLQNQSEYFQPCLVIPVYNHGEELKQTLTELHEYRIPCFVVDDGSDNETKQVLKDASLEHDWIEIIALQQNCGKGAAVSAGLLEAIRRGFTHALQIDADGQHNTRDVPRLLGEAQQRPKALILARPKFDHSAPMIRLLGRQFTKVLVWLQTRSFQIEDALCGFRVYPLASTVEVLQSFEIGQRMQFDPEIAVRLCWRGVEIRNIDSQVRYNSNGVSHFHYFNDNIRIAKTHVQLLIASLFPASKNKSWTQINERGTLFALRLLLFLYRLVGGRIGKALCYPVSIYFFLTGGIARRASVAYLKRVLPRAWPGRKFNIWWKSYLHFVSFAQGLLDRLSAWDGRLNFVTVDWRNREIVKDLVSRGQGAVVMSAHFGNLEVIRAASVFGGHVTINALMFTRNAEKYNRLLRELNSNSHVHVIATEQVSSDLIVRLREKISAGEMVTILADRVTEGAPSKTKEFDFLGEKVLFPTGPFLLAGMLQCPILAVFCTRQGSNTYQARVMKLSERLSVERKERDKNLNQIMKQYIKVLEEEVLLSPLEWYNFYDFFNQGRSTISLSQQSSPRST